MITTILEALISGRCHVHCENGNNRDMNVRRSASGELSYAIYGDDGSGIYMQIAVTRSESEAMELLMEQPIVS